MRIAVIVSDASGMVQAGLDVTRTVRLFDMPEGMREYIASRVQPYGTIVLVMEEAAPIVKDNNEHSC